MTAIMTALFILSLLGCCLGYGVFIKRGSAFFPLLYISSFVLVLYVFGLAGLLKVGLYAVLGIGILLIPFSIYKGKGRVVDALKGTLTDPSLYFMIAGTVWVYLITKGVGVSHADDFSHWYRMCKMMHVEGAYPTKPDMSFTTYAPGTATWIWFITSVIGFGPDKCFFAHSLINLSALNAFFSLCGPEQGKDVKISRKAVVFVFAAIMSVALCSMNVNTYCLLADTTIALVPMAAMFLVLSSEKKADLTDTVMFIVFMCFTILIKVSGIPFVIFVSIFRHGLIKKSIKSSKKKWISALAPVLIPVAAFYAYIIRANIVFGNIEVSGQGFSLTRFIAMFLLKTGDQVNAIIKRFFYEMFALFGDVSMQVRLLWLTFAAAAVILFVLRKKKGEQYTLLRRITLALIVFFILYSIMLLLTYLFSMYENEADSQHLNCFYRYIGSMTMFVFGVVMYVIFGLLEKADRKILTIGTAALCIIPVAVAALMFDLGYVAGFKYYKPQEVFTTASWDLLNEYAQEREEYNEDTYLVIYNGGDVADAFELKTRLAAIVYFRSNNVYAFTIEDLEDGRISEDSLAVLPDCDYLVTLGDFSDKLDIIREYVDVGAYTPGMNEL